MTDKELNDKLGAMHLRLLDDSKSYGVFVSLLMEYAESFEDYGSAVIKALREGLENAERYLNMESALSPRAIIIEKRQIAKGLSISKADAEGYYRISFLTDDEQKIKIRFDRKQSQLLYILFLMCYQKNGLLADFFIYKKEDNTPVLKKVVELIQLIYPHMDEHDAMAMAKDLASDRSFTDCLQKLKASLTDSLCRAKLGDDLYWFMPYAENLSKKQLYKFHIPQAQIYFPEEFLPIIEAMPDACEYLKKEDIDTCSQKLDMESDLAWWQKEAKKGDAEGLYYTGVYYGTGDVVRQDYKKSAELFEKAASKGHLGAMFQLGVYHMFGFGVEKDIYKALELFEKAAAEGHAEAAAWAGQIYEYETDGVKLDHKKAFDLYMIAAKQNIEEAMWYVIQGYLLGHGTRKNFDKAHEWFKKAEALGFYKIVTLYGVHYYNQGDKESLKKAYQLFSDGAKAGIPMAYYFMGKIAAKGFHRLHDWTREAEYWFTKAAMCEEKMGIEALMWGFPEVYRKKRFLFEDRATMRETFIKQVGLMKSNMVQKIFIDLVDAYREKWHKSYVAEMCKQLNIHKKPDGNEGERTQTRRITVRKTKRGEMVYEIVLTLANGDEVIVNKINPRSLTLLILTIICSMKSGYTTMMAVNRECRPVLKTLVQLVNGDNVSNLDRYVEEMMGYEKDVTKKLNEDYYKQYSNKAKNAIKAAVGMRDEASYFVFENTKTIGRKNLRHMIMDRENITLPQELMELAISMPDAMDILQVPDIQTDKEIIKE